MAKLIASTQPQRPSGRSGELITLGRTLKQRANDVLAYFDRPGTSNGPTEAINGRLEHLRGSALGFRNLTNYVAQSTTRVRRISDHDYTLDCEEPRNPHPRGRADAARRCPASAR